MRNQLQKVIIRIISFLVIFATINPGFIFSQAKIAQHVFEIKTRGHFKEKIVPFSVVPNKNPELLKVVKKFSILNLDNTVLEKILDKRPENLIMLIPFDGNKNFTVLLYKADISTAGYTLLTSDNRTNDPVKNNTVNYRGAIENDPRSVVSFSFSDSETMGMISNDQGNFVLGKVERDRDGSFIIYNDKELIPQNTFGCEQRSIPANARTQGLVSTTNETSAISSTTESTTSQLTTKCVNWYWETDYDLFLNKGSLANVNAYIQGVFNQVSTLYANDGISINLKTLFVWTSVDPYTGPSTGSFLNQFVNYRTSWDGDLAHLIGLAGNGGIAYVNGIQMCEWGSGQVSAQKGYSGISSGYSSVPTYSWTVGCISHELGHQLGSNHTHDCVWNGNNTKIDDCGGYAGYSAGNCLPQPSPVLPVGGGTIMSYCHLTGAGINFNLGFGPQPTALMTNRINSSTCLTSCNSCSVPVQPGIISGNTSVCANTSKTYSVVAVPGATSYTWTIPSGWTGTSTTNSITVTTGTDGGVITVKANNSCGGSSAQSLSVSCGIPSQPGTISGTTAICSNASQTYSVAPVSGATSYTWTIPTGWSGSSTTNSITVIPGNTGGVLTVNASNSCGTGSGTSLTVAVSSALAAEPGAITGNTNPCAGVSETYSIAAVTGATSYTWTLPSGWTGSSTTNSISVITGTSGGTLSVKANNFCETSASSSLAITYSGVPSTPGTITISGGMNKVCPGDNRTLSVPLIAGLTYQWTIPTGVAITGGQGANIIGVSFTSSFTASGAISVKAVNACGSSSARNTTIYTNLPGIPGTITVKTGNAKVCPGDVVTYTVTAIAGLTYKWIPPAGAEIITGQGTNTVTVTYNAGFTANGNLSVSAINSCGSSSARNYTVYRNLPVTPSSIAVTGGIAKVCPGDIRTYTVTAVAGITYNWLVPTGAVINSGQGSNSIIVTFNSGLTSSGNIAVTATNNCATSTARTLSVLPNSPLTPGSISGPTGICIGSVTTYSITAVSNATSYVWTVPAGASIQSGQGSTSIKVLWNSTAGNISVRSSNNCGTSAAKTISVSVNCPSSIVASPHTSLEPIVFPNPTEGILTLRFYAQQEGEFNIQLHDPIGRVLRIENIIAIRGINTKQYNWSFLANGMYFITVKNKFSKKVVKFEMR